MLNPLTIPVSDDLWLAPLTGSDRSAIVEFLNDREISDRMLRVPHPYDSADFDSFLELAASTDPEGLPRHFTLHHGQHGPIGGFGFEALRQGHRVEIGYWLGRKFWGQGIMPRVIRSACEFAFREFQVRRITAHVFTSNVASARALEKSGFVFEGLLRKCFMKNDTPIDARLFALLESDLPPVDTLTPTVSVETTPLRIERATERDLANVAALFDGYRQFYGQIGNLPAAAEFLGERLALDESTIFVARMNGEAVGFTQLYPAFSSVSMMRILILNDLFVVPACRKLGVGEALIEAAVRHGREKHCRRIVLCTEATNTVSQSLYESRGWVRDESFLHYQFEL